MKYISILTKCLLIVFSLKQSFGSHLTLYYLRLIQLLMWAYRLTKKLSERRGTVSPIAIKQWNEKRIIHAYNTYVQLHSLISTSHNFRVKRLMPHYTSQSLPPSYTNLTRLGSLQSQRFRSEAMYSVSSVASTSAWDPIMMSTSIAISHPESISMGYNLCSHEAFSVGYCQQQQLLIPAVRIPCGIHHYHAPQGLVEPLHHAVRLWMVHWRACLLNVP